MFLIIADGWAVAIRHDLKDAKRLVKDLKAMGYTCGFFPQKSLEHAEELYCWWNYSKQKGEVAKLPPANWGIRNGLARG